VHSLKPPAPVILPETTAKKIDRDEKIIVEIILCIKRK